MKKAFLSFTLLLFIIGNLFGCRQDVAESEPVSEPTSSPSQPATSVPTVTAPIASFPDNSDTQPEPDYTWDTTAPTQVLTLMNDARAKAGLDKLRMDNGNMMTAAKTRAKEIIGAFGHERPDGRSCFSVFQEYTIEYAYAGENLAAGQPTPETVFSSLWNSETHRANMLGEHFTHVSIVCLNDGKSLYWVQLFRG